MSKEISCKNCGSSNTKQGKLFGIAGVHSLSARSGIGGSDVIVTFCADCGEILSMKVEHPEKIQ